GVTSTTNTYSPYIDVGDEAYPDQSHDTLITGQDYQEVLTSLPLGTSALTGLFLNVTFSGPGGPVESVEKTLVDRIGYAARQEGGPVSANFDPNGPPAVTSADVFTMNVLPGSQPSAPIVALQSQFSSDQSLLADLNTTNAGSTDIAQETSLLRLFHIDLT